MFRVRLLSAVVLVLTGFAGGLLLEARPLTTAPRGVLSQKKGKVEEEEEDKPTKPDPKKKKVVEEEEPVVKKKVVSVEEDDKPTTSAVVRAVNLRAAAKAAKNPDVKKLYETFALGSDQIKRKALARIKPLPFYAKYPARPKQEFTIDIIDDEGNVKATEKVKPLSVDRVYYYETEAVTAVKTFLAVKGPRDTSDPRFLLESDRYITAETVLEAVLAQHGSWRASGARDNEKGEWNEVEAALRQELLAVKLHRLGVLVKARNWDQAFELSRHITDTFRAPREQEQIAPAVGELLDGAVFDDTQSKERREAARGRLREFLKDFPNSPAVAASARKLQGQAEQLYKRAKLLAKDGKDAEALALGREAADLWPELPGLESLREKTKKKHPILNVSMRERPKYHSPAFAVTDADRRSVDLLFESLVVLAPDENGMLYYRPSLARGRVRVVPRGREFELPREARWSDGQELTAADVGFCVEEIKKGRFSTGRGGDWGELLAKNRVEGDPFRVRLLLTQGCLDPLSAMSFELVPPGIEGKRPAPNSKEFASAPVGSGPFVLAGDSSDENKRPITWYKANPYYLARSGALPHVREVRVYSGGDPVKDLKAGITDLAMDLTAAQAAALRDAGYEVPLPGPSSVNRRIYYLATNCREGRATKLADMRLALALAIDREGLLDKHFRPGLGNKVHRPLNGPYPARSWACNPKLVKGDAKTLDPYDPDLAAAKASQALKQLDQKEVTLTLAYPSGDDTLKAAMEDLCDRVGKVLPGVKLTPKALAPHDLRGALATTDFDLAYCCYDFPDESFWLMPLLGIGFKDPELNSEPLLGYTGNLVNKVQDATKVRNFADARKAAHAIHQMHLQVEMPFVPLWQLDPLCAYKKGRIEAVPFDAYRTFARIERWRLK